ncbi:hypothetical protein WS67_05905 [Burkholderia singularis]|uniref:Uncharacterized protein n=1 Tax=Burkholderia singularis TaxID=1503053 RepID=A0A103E774_9BURK|nr:hypothetical protein WS67_05905 [Burkholderia singularis]
MLPARRRSTLGTTTRRSRTIHRKPASAGAGPSRRRRGGHRTVCARGRRGHAVPVARRAATRRRVAVSRSASGK